MKVLVLNSGSSSIKYQLFHAADWRVLAAGAVNRIGEPRGEFSGRWRDAAGEEQGFTLDQTIANHREGLGHIVARLRETQVLAGEGDLTAIGHRVVHGGEAFHRPTRIDDEVMAVIRGMSPLAPLHNPANLAGIEVALNLFPGVPQVAVFDTAFHQTMPPAAYRYALPEELYKAHRVRRYGFHGTSHAYVSRRAAALLGKAPQECNLITLHLGNGASATAVRGGESIDTSMGLTPLEGLVMGTRCGDLDPAIHFYLANNLGMDIQALDDLFNRRSGLLGLCGVNDMREIHRRIGQGDSAAALALEVFCHRLRKYLGAYWVELGRLDALVFTGGIGENDAEVRARTCAGLEGMGILLDEAANQARGQGERRVSRAESPVAVLVIPTNEELEIARQTLEAIERIDSRSGMFPASSTVS